MTRAKTKPPKRGRPPKAAGEILGAKTLILWLPGDLEAIDRAAALAAMTRSQFIRHATTGRAAQILARKAAGK